MPFWEGLKKKTPQTVKFKKGIKKNSLRYEYKVTLKENLRSGKCGIREAIKLQEGMDKNEWIAMNAIEAYNTLLMVYGFIDGECTPQTCPKMTAGPLFEYYWASDGKSESLDAPSYIDKLFSWIADLIDDESIFSTDGNYSKKFIPTVKKMLSRMFRVYAHIYCLHFNAISQNNAKEHLDKCFKHYYYFVDEFKMVSEKEMKPLAPLIEQLK